MRNICILLGLILSCSSQCFGSAPNDSIKYVGFIIYEKMPSFPGGEKAMFEFVKEHITLPQSARKAGIDGRVVVRFLVNEDGRITDPFVMRGIHPECDSIAITIIKKMPRWEPASTYGKPGSIHFTMPIVFKLPNEPNMVDGREIYKKPRREAKFPDGDFSEILQDLLKPVKIDTEAIYYGNKVGLQLLVNKDGEVEDVQVLFTAIASLNYAKIKEKITLMPKWIPAKHKGKAVDSYVNVPLSF